jgi:NitT/TauT family transport system substrate-binding protein
MRKVIPAALVIAAALAVTACGDDEQPTTGGGGGQELTTVRVGVIPITPVAPVYLGIEQGFFEEEGLRVEPQLAQGGAAIVPSVQSGDFQFGFSNSVSLMIAQTQGLPVRVVAPGEAAPANADEDNSAVMVPPDSDIREPADLAGKRIGVNTLKNIAGLTVEASLEKLGVDTSAIDLVEVPFPEMLATTQSGDIDAGFFNEPFTTAAEAAGLRTIINPYAGTAPDLPIAPYFTLQPYIDENPEIVAAFQRGMEKSTQYARDNPEELRRILTTYTEIPQEVVGEIGLPHLTSELRPENFQELADIAQQLGYVEEAPNVDELLVLPGEAG